MNESDFESELRALRPVPPTPGLARRIAADLEPHSIALAEPRALRPRTAGVLVAPRSASTLLFDWLRRLGWAAAGAATAVAALVYFQKDTPQPMPAAPAIAAAELEVGEFIPAESESELVAADETGVVYLEGDEPVRQMRFHSVERYAWTNPETGARVEVAVPREDVLLMPVAMQ